MKLHLKIEIAEKCWKNSLNWTFEQIDIFNDIYNEKGKIIDFENSKKTLLLKKEKIEREKEIIKSEFQKINMNFKPIRNFKKSLEKLLNSTEINFSKRMIIPPEPFDLYKSISNPELNVLELDNYIEIVKKNLETNWISFNQSYGRMLIKMKINHYDSVD